MFISKEGILHTKEFKDSTVQLAINSEKSVFTLNGAPRKIEADLDVNTSVIIM